MGDWPVWHHAAASCSFNVRYATGWHDVNSHARMFHTLDFLSHDQVTSVSDQHSISATAYTSV